MPSQAYIVDLDQLLVDADDLDDAHFHLQNGALPWQHGLGALNRVAVVVSVSAWESYIEALMREAIQALHPGGAGVGIWNLLQTHADEQIKRFHTPDSQKVKKLIASCLGLGDVTTAWVWPQTTAVQAVQRLNDALTLRHQIAHGVNPRPNVNNRYSSQLPALFRKLGLCTDAAVRNHLVTIHGVANPWPP